jgi:dihydroneopterin aldolase
MTGTVRTDFLVRVADVGDALAALAGGADRIGLAESRGPLAPDAIRAILRAVGGRCPVSAPLSAIAAAPQEAARTLAACGVDTVEIPVDDDAVACLAAVRAALPSLRAVARLHVAGQPNLSGLGALAEAGFRGVMLMPARRPAPRLIDRPGIEVLSQFVEAAQRRGLEAGFGGGLEAPDVPRMLALSPDVLDFHSHLCRDDDATQPLDPGRIAMMRGLIPRQPTPPASRPMIGEGETHPLAADKVFVRDFIIEAGIGAYGHEYRKAQRMRFNVEADLVRIADDVADMRDIFSYDVIVDAIRLATRRHALLVEKVALDVAAASLRDPRVRRVRVRVEKLDILNGSVGVEIERTASRDDRAALQAAQGPAIFKP